MPMPDFSFLSNRRGDTSIGDLMSGLTQGFQMAQQAKTQKQAAELQKEQMALQKNEFQMQQVKFVQGMMADQAKNKLMAGISEKTKDIKDPYEAAKAGVMFATQAGAHDVAASFAKTAKDLYVPPDENKPFSVDAKDPKGGSMKVWVQKDRDPNAVDSGLTKIGVNLPGHKKVSEGGEKPETFDRSLRVMPLLNKNLEESRQKQKDLDGSITQLNQLLPNMQGLSTWGPLEGARKMVSDLADLAGMPFNEADRRTAASAGSDRLAVLVMKAFGGSDTEKEFGWGKNTLPNLLQDQVGRIRVMTDLLKYKQRESEVENLFEKETLKHMSDGTVGEKTSKDILDKYNKEKPIKSMDSPVKLDLLNRGEITQDVADGAEKALKFVAEKFPKRKSEYVRDFALKFKYIPTGY